MATEHLGECVRILREALAFTSGAMTNGYAAVLALIDLDWEPTKDRDELTWREGYEQCMTDICEAIGQEWGIPLPADPQRQGAPT